MADHVANGGEVTREAEDDFSQEDSRSGIDEAALLESARQRASIQRHHALFYEAAHATLQRVQELVPGSPARAEVRQSDETYGGKSQASLVGKSVGSLPTDPSKPGSYRDHLVHRGNPTPLLGSPQKNSTSIGGARALTSPVRAGVGDGGSLLAAHQSSSLMATAAAASQPQASSHAGSPHQERKAESRRKLEAWVKSWHQKRLNAKEAEFQLELARRLKQHGLQPALVSLIADEKQDALLQAEGTATTPATLVMQPNSVSTLSASSSGEQVIIDHFPLPPKKRRPSQDEGLSLPLNGEEEDEDEDDEKIESMYKQGALDEQSKPYPKGILKDKTITDDKSETEGSPSPSPKASGRRATGVSVVGFQDRDEPESPMEKVSTPKPRRRSTPGVKSRDVKALLKAADDGQQDEEAKSKDEEAPRELRPGASLVELLGLPHSVNKTPESEYQLREDVNAPHIHAQHVVAVRPAKLRVFSDTVALNDLSRRGGRDAHRSTGTSKGAKAEYQLAKSRQLRIVPSSSALQKDITPTEAAHYFPDVVGRAAQVVYTSGIILPRIKVDLDADHQHVDAGSSRSSTRTPVPTHSANRPIQSVLALRDGLTIREVALDHTITLTSARASSATPEERSMGILVSRCYSSRAGRRLVSRKATSHSGEPVSSRVLENSVSFGVGEVASDALTLPSSSDGTLVSGTAELLFHDDPELLELRRLLRKHSKAPASSTGESGVEAEIAAESSSTSEQQDSSHPRVTSLRVSPEVLKREIQSPLDRNHKKAVSLSSSLRLSKAVLNVLEGAQLDPVAAHGATSPEMNQISSATPTVSSRSFSPSRGANSPQESSMKRRLDVLTQAISPSRSQSPGIERMRLPTAEPPEVDDMGLSVPNPQLASHTTPRSLSELLLSPSPLGFQSIQNDRGMKSSLSSPANDHVGTDRLDKSPTDSATGEKPSNRSPPSPSCRRTLNALNIAAQAEQVVRLREGMRYALREESSGKIGTGNIGGLNPGYVGKSEPAPNFLDSKTLQPLVEKEQIWMTSPVDDPADPKTQQQRSPRPKAISVSTGLVRVKPISMSDPERPGQTKLYDVVQVVSTRVTNDESGAVIPELHATPTPGGIQQGEASPRPKARATRGFMPQKVREYRTSERLVNAARNALRRTKERLFSVEHIEDLIERSKQYEAQVLSGHTRL